MMHSSYYTAHSTPFQHRSFFIAISDAFYRINYRGYVTAALLCIITTAVCAYLAALFITLGAGFGTEQQLQELSRAKLSVREALFEMQKQKTEILKTQKFTFESMEKISSIQYITPHGVALSSAFPRNV